MSVDQFPPIFNQNLTIFDSWQLIENFIDQIHLRFSNCQFFFIIFFYAFKSN